MSARTWMRRWGTSMMCDIRGNAFTVVAVDTVAEIPGAEALILAYRSHPYEVGHILCREFVDPVVTEALSCNNIATTDGITGELVDAARAAFDDAEARLAEGLATLYRFVEHQRTRRTALEGS